MTHLPRLQEIEIELKENKTITRELAREIDELTEGEISKIAHVNSFTESPSTQHVDTALSIVAFSISRYDITLNADEAQNLLRSLKRRRNDLEDSFKISISVSLMMKILSGSLVIKDTPIVNMTPKEVVEHSSELNETFNKTLSVSKLSVSAEEFDGVNRIRVFDVVNKRRLDDHISSISSLIDYIEKAISNDVVLVIDNRSERFRLIKKYNNDLLGDLAEFVLCLIEDIHYLG